MKHPIFALANLITVVFVTLASGLVHEVKADPGTGTLFGTDAAGGNLLTINPTTGTGTVVGFIAGSVPALATDPTTGILYAGQGGGAPNLYTVDLTTGVATFVGDTGLGTAAIGGMDFSAEGTLYAAVNIAGNGGTGSDHLAIIDKTTGAATVIGPFGLCVGVTIPSFGGGACSIEGIEAIAFDASGTLWGALSARRAAGTPGLYTIDPATGAAAFVALIVDTFGIPPSGGIVSLQFGCGGTLYGGTATAISPASDGGRLVTIDPATGLFAFVGAVSATGGSSLGALAFQNSCVSKFKGQAEKLGTGNAKVVIEGQFTFSGDLGDLRQATATITHVLDEAGLDLVAGGSLPLTLAASRGGKVTAVIFRTPDRARPQFWLEFKNRGKEVFTFRLVVEFAGSLRPGLCAGVPPTTNLTTSFTIMGQEHVAVTTTKAWRCVAGGKELTIETR